MKILRKIWMIASVITVITVLNACEKSLNDLNDPAVNLESVMTKPVDYSAILDIMEMSEVDEVVEVENTLKSASDTEFARCFEVIVHQNDSATCWPRSWTFSYSDSACTDFHGNVRLGSVHVSLTNFWKNEGSIRTISFEDYTINGNQLEGTKTIANVGLNEDGNLTFERSFENASFTRGDTATISWNANRNVEMIAGFDTFLAADDEYLVNGGAEGTNYDGLPFTINIEEPLYYKKCSRFPVSGNLLIKVNDTLEITIDYGDGECDNIAEMTVDGEISEITLGCSPC